MSLRAEYSHAFVFNDKGRKWEVTVFHHQNKQAEVVGRESVNFEYEIGSCADRLINDHMEKVTRILEGGPIDPDKAEEADRIARKADHDNQCEKDLE